MKCPKCSYLGFETGDRCKNCGYDFSLLTASGNERPPDLPLRESDSESGVSESADWLDQLDRGLASAVSSPTPPAPSVPLAPMPLDTVVTSAPIASSAAASAAGRARIVDAARTASRRTPSLPLFQPGGDDDEPLIKVPAAPRPPLAVRRTPDKPRLRAVPRPAAAREAAEEVAEPVDPLFRLEPEANRPRPAQRPAARPLVASGPLARLGAAAIDHLILAGIDLTVIYFTLKMAGLTTDQWTMVPPAPVIAFLALVKAAYFCAFTLVGGQTIGKMATSIRVISDDGGQLQPSQAIQRTMTGLLSLLTLGVAYLPMLFAEDRRAVHDRIARTRVVAHR